jgi:hypothetical protein
MEVYNTFNSPLPVTEKLLSSMINKLISDTNKEKYEDIL